MPSPVVPHARGKALVVLPSRAAAPAVLRPPVSDGGGEADARIEAGPAPRSVRISLTDRCDFACVYCRPSRADGYLDSKLSLTEWETVFAGLRDAGIVRVRLTGGEPLLHPDVVGIVERLLGLGFEDIALTTNASQLRRFAVPLRRAGLMRINVSIDTLDPERFRAMTRGGDLHKVLDGLDAAADAGLAPIKTNTVVVAGENDDELEALLEWAWERRYVPRFLEVMPIAEGAKYRHRVVSVRSMQQRLQRHLADAPPAKEAGLGPALYVPAQRDASLRVGFISGTTDTFCATCDRLRVSSGGMLRPCLATDEGVEARDVAARADREGFVQRVREAWARKPDGNVWKGCTEQTAAQVSMRAIGG